MFNLAITLTFELQVKYQRDAIFVDFVDIEYRFFKVPYVEIKI